jgi:hypothetical protein
VTGRQPSITELFDQGTPIDRALRLGVRDALLRHKLLGQRVAVWKRGRVVILEPEDIPVKLPGKTPARQPRKRIRRGR